VRAAGFACAGAVAVALSAFSLQGRGEDAPEADPAVALPSAAVPSPTPAEGSTAGPAKGSTQAEPAPASATGAAVAAAPVAPTPSPAPGTTLGRADGGGTPTENRSRRGRRSFRNDFEDLPLFAEWVPPEGPVRIALQAGHWRSAEAPDELSDLRNNGANAAGKAEWEVNLEIARRTAARLEAMGYAVDILPTTVPPSYRAHLFIAIHADGALDPAASGYRVAAPRRDPTQKAAGFVELLERTYAEATGLKRLGTVTRRMQAYYAFNSRRYRHALHPMTIGVIIETGFLTSPSDRRLIVDDPDRVARGIAEAVRQFPLTPPPNGDEAR
jgi:N-acetylmuramoyl-L-alanine amidase